MDDNCGEWVECTVASGYLSRWVWLVGVGGIYGCGNRVECMGVVIRTLWLAGGGSLAWNLWVWLSGGGCG